MKPTVTVRRSLASIGASNCLENFTIPALPYWSLIGKSVTVTSEADGYVGCGNRHCPRFREAIQNRIDLIVQPRASPPVLLRARTDLLSSEPWFSFASF